MGIRLWRLFLTVLAMFVTGIALEDKFGIPFATTLRVGCAAMCLIFIISLRRDYPGERWPLIALPIALVVNIGLFFTPLFDRPVSRGEILLFALPDAIVLLVARIASYRVADVHQRAMRQQMILGLIVAVVFCALLLGLTLMQVHTSHSSRP
jgi:hypothetical protein